MNKALAIIKLKTHTQKKIPKLQTPIMRVPVYTGHLRPDLVMKSKST